MTSAERIGIWRRTAEILRTRSTDVHAECFAITLDRCADDLEEDARENPECDSPTRTLLTSDKLSDTTAAAR